MSGHAAVGNSVGSSPASSSVFSFNSSPPSSSASSASSSGPTVLNTPSTRLRADSAGSSLQPSPQSDASMSSPSPTRPHKRKLSDEARVEQQQRQQQLQQHGERLSSEVGKDEGVEAEEEEEESEAEDLSDGEDDELVEVVELDGEERSSSKPGALLLPSASPCSPTTAAAVALVQPERTHSESSPTAAFAQLSTSSAASPSSSSPSSSPTSTPPGEQRSTSSGSSSTKSATASSLPLSFPSSTGSSSSSSSSSSGSSSSSAASTPTGRPSTRKSRPNDWFCFQGCGKHYKKSSGRSIRRHALSCYRTHHAAECRGMSDAEVHALLAIKQEDGEVQTGLRAWRLRQSRRQASELPQHERWECPNGCRQYYRSTSSKSIEKHTQTCTVKAHGSKPPPLQQQLSGGGLLAAAISSRVLSSPQPLVRQESGSSGSASSQLDQALLAGMSSLNPKLPLGYTSLTPQQLSMLQQHAHNEALLTAVQQQQQQQLFAQSLSGSSLPAMQSPQSQLALTSQQLMQLQQALYMQQQQQAPLGSSSPASLSQLFMSTSTPLPSQLAQQSFMSDGTLLSAASTVQQTQQPSSFAFPSSFSPSPSSNVSYLTASPTAPLNLTHFQHLSASSYLPALSQANSTYSVANMPLLSSAMQPSTGLAYSLSSLPPLSSHSLLAPLTSVSASAHSLCASSTLPSTTLSSQAQLQSGGAMHGLVSLLPPSLSSAMSSHVAFGLPTSSSSSASSLSPYAPLQASSLHLSASFPSSALGSASFGPSSLSSLQPTSFLPAGVQSPVASFHPSAGLSSSDQSALSAMSLPSLSAPMPVSLSGLSPLAPTLSGGLVFSPSHATGLTARPPSLPR